MELPGRKLSTFVVEAARSYRKTHWKRWGAKPPTVSNGFCGRRGPFGLQKIDDCWPGSSIVTSRSLTWAQGQILDFSFSGALESISRVNCR